MKKRLLVLSVLVLVLGTMVVPALAWVQVPGFGDTGWQTYTFTAGAGGFKGTAGFLVSNQFDTAGPSELLLRQVTPGPTGNDIFQSGDYTDYTLVDQGGTNYSDGVILTVAFAESGVQYDPVSGGNISSQYATNLDDSGVDTSPYLNQFNQAGTVGSILTLPVDLGEGGTLVFEWAFLSHDYLGLDFSKFLLWDESGVLVSQDGLGQQVPLPSTLLFVGSGLACLVGLRRKLGF